MPAFSQERLNRRRATSNGSFSLTLTLGTLHFSHETHPCYPVAPYARNRIHALSLRSARLADSSGPSVFADFGPSRYGTMEPDNAVDEEVRTGHKQGSPCKRMEPREPANTGGSD